MESRIIPFPVMMTVHSIDAIYFKGKCGFCFFPFIPASSFYILYTSCSHYRKQNSIPSIKKTGNHRHCPNCIHLSARCHHREHRSRHTAALRTSHHEHGRPADHAPRSPDSTDYHHPPGQRPPQSLYASHIAGAAGTGRTLPRHLHFVRWKNTDMLI